MTCMHQMELHAYCATCAASKAVLNATSSQQLVCMRLQTKLLCLRATGDHATSCQPRKQMSTRSFLLCELRYSSTLECLQISCSVHVQNIALCNVDGWCNTDYTAMSTRHASCAHHAFAAQAVSDVLNHPSTRLRTLSGTHRSVTSLTDVFSYLLCLCSVLKARCTQAYL